MQKYLCKQCGCIFQSKRKTELEKKLFKEYVWKKQNLEDLSEKYSLNPRVIQRKINEYEPEFKTKQPREIVAVIDATFFGKKVNKFGVAAIADPKEKEVVARSFIQSENIIEYALLRYELGKQVFVLKSVTIDGRKALFSVFGDVLIQMCHFHQKAIVRRYITSNPKLEASQELKAIVDTLSFAKEEEFKKQFLAYLDKYNEVLKEKTYNPQTNRFFYTHKKLRSATFSIKRNLEYLFTYQRYPELNIPNTTNCLDGSVFSQLKKLMRVHSGMSENLKRKFIDEVLENYSKKDKFS